MTPSSASQPASKTMIWLGMLSIYIVWGSTGIPSEGPGPVKVWQETFAPQASGEPVESGHYLTEENPQGVLKAVLPFLTHL